jgi:hypothetical protein
MLAQSQADQQMLEQLAKDEDLQIRPALTDLMLKVQQSMGH